ncbi:DUF1214 domain-containing protein [Gordonia sp. NPDC003376]
MIKVNADNFVRAESDVMFGRLLADSGGVGVWRHYREPTPLDHQPIVRQNRDTLYSQCIVDATDGVVLDLPEAGGRYMSAMVVTRDHHIPLIIHRPGTHRFDAAAVGSDFVLIGVRTLVDPGDSADVAEVNRLQDLLRVRTGSSRPFVVPDYDPDAAARTRTSLLALSADLPDFRGAFGPAGEVDPIRHLLGSASGWGGLPGSEATYVNVTPTFPDGVDAAGEFQMVLRDVPVDAFWSVSIYDADGYFRSNPLGVNNINSVTAAPEGDGSVIVRFGTHPAGEPNYLYTMPGWNLLIRLYRPHAEVVNGTWSAPAVRPVGA